MTPLIDYNDWITKAMIEVDALGITASPADIELLVRKYCPPMFTPFEVEVGVAYMPVPRCDGCKHWEQGVIPGIKRPSHSGVCSNPELRAFDANQTIETAKDFGCVQYEQK